MYNISDDYIIQSIVSGVATFEEVSEIAIKDLDIIDQTAELVITLSPRMHNVEFMLEGGEFVNENFEVKNNTYVDIDLSIYTLSSTMAVPVGSSIVLPSAQKPIETVFVTLIHWDSADGSFVAGEEIDITKDTTLTAKYDLP